MNEPTTTLSQSSFTTDFRALTSHSPMRWQERLYQQLQRSQIPHTCDLPTGIGKSSVIVLWLLALADQSASGNVSLPRRLVYVVNRRTVVDQATEIVQSLRERLLDPDRTEWSDHAHALRRISQSLQRLCVIPNPPLAVSTLRGELEDNGEWKADPARPAVIIGTIDMIGSKLLFNGYGDGRYHRAHHTGLLGNDSLIVHDEAHLSPSFSRLLRDLERQQESEAQTAQAVSRPIRILELSATTRTVSIRSFTLKQEDKSDPKVEERIHAAKTLRLHTCESKTLEKRLVTHALKHKGTSARVLVYVCNPDWAVSIANALRKELDKPGEQKRRVALLTGSMRGFERERLLKQNPVVRHFIEPSNLLEHAVFLVSTAAGEVGIDIDADHMVSDLTTLDALIQRLGRINRRGGKHRHAQIDVLDRCSTSNLPSAQKDAVDATRNLLESWQARSEDGMDASSHSLQKLLTETDDEVVQKALPPEPLTVELTDVTLDQWSLTSVKRLPRQIPVHPFLHGVTWDPPETHVVWRAEVEHLCKAHIENDAIEDWFRACRIEARERIQLSSHQCHLKLKRLIKTHRNHEQSQGFHCLIIDPGGSVTKTTLSELSKQDHNTLFYRTLVLPPRAGGLSPGGSFDPKAVPPTTQPPEDVGNRPDLVPEQQRKRLLHERRGEEETFRDLLTDEMVSIPTNLVETFRIRLDDADEDEEEGSITDLVLYLPQPQSALVDPETAASEQSLEEHHAAARSYAAQIAKKLELPENVRSALENAAANHDLGKARAIWQRYACNSNSPRHPVAKSTRYRHPKTLAGYRHELGSLLELSNMPSLHDHPERDLLLHLVAAHHGWARPHFESRAFDNNFTARDNVEAVEETMRRFARLQRRFGRWGLAWLESLLRCADIAASAAGATTKLPAHLDDSNEDSRQ